MNLLSIGDGFETIGRSSIHIRRTTRLFSQSPPSSSSDTVDVVQQHFVDLTKRLAIEGEEILQCASIALSPYFGSEKNELATPEGIVKICDVLDDEIQKTDKVNIPSAESVQQPWISSSSPFRLRTRALEFQRYEALVQMMKSNYTSYVATASFLSPNRIPRRQLPNLQDIPFEEPSSTKTTTTTERLIIDETTGLPLVADCELEDMKYEDSPLDKLLLSIFRDLVKQNTGGVTSTKAGIEGLLEQGRTFMLKPDQTPEAQHKMVRDTLGGLMTPVLPPFYRIFMSGIIPNSVGGPDWGGKQIGPWFYAPFLTAFVTPTFFKFLVGPSYPNRRRDGQLGGLVVC